MSSIARKLLFQYIFMRMSPVSVIPILNCENKYNSSLKYNSIVLLDQINRTFSQSQNEAMVNNCWNCKKHTKRLNKFFCLECGSLLDPVKEADYFSLLNIESTFAVNLNELTKQFRQMQNLIHPDKYSNKGEREQINSQGWSSLINKAYKTLLTPIERGEYILKNNNIEIPEDNSSLDKEFLMEMMERNEDVDDAASNKMELEDLLMEINKDLEVEIKNLNKSFMEKDLEKSKLILVKMKYFKRIEKNIKNKLERLFGT